MESHEREWRKSVRELRRQGVEVALRGVQGSLGFTWLVGKGDERYILTERQMINLHRAGKLTLPGIRELDKRLRFGLGQPGVVPAIRSRAIGWEPESRQGTTSSSNVEEAAMNSGVSRVFLDTEVFIHENFNYTSPRFESLMTLASARRIQVFLTELTLREIESNIRSHVDKAVASIRPPTTQANVLKNSDLRHIKALFDKPDAAPIQEELIGQLKKYLKAAKATVLKVPTTVLPPVLDAYFEKQPPFGPRKKKAEFPDALVLETLRKWCAQKESVLAVVSGDKGVKEACKRALDLHYFEDITKYLDAFFAFEEELSSFVRKMIPEARGPIFEKAKEAFAYLGAFLGDEEGDVEEIKLTQLELDEEDFAIISLAPDKAEVVLAVSMTFLADLHFMKPGTSSWDGQYVKGRVDQDLEGIIGVEVAFENLNPQSFEVRRVWFEGNQDIEVNADFDNNWDKWRDAAG